MDRRNYDQLLANYREYVALVEKLCRMRQSGEVPAGSPVEREWRKTWQRIEESIGQTTGKLDILEQRNPEMAAEERVSERARIAALHAKLLELPAQTTPFFPPRSHLL